MNLLHASSITLKVGSNETWGYCRYLGFDVKAQITESEDGKSCTVEYKDPDGRILGQSTGLLHLSSPNKTRDVREKAAGEVLKKAKARDDIFKVLILNKVKEECKAYFKIYKDETEEDFELPDPW